MRGARDHARVKVRLAAAALKAGRPAQAVGGDDDFEFVPAAGPWRVVEVQFEIAERFSRKIRERRAAEADHGIGQARTGGLQMALHAHFELPLRRQPRRVDDLRPNFGWRGIAPLGCPDVLAARTMAALAVDSLR